MMAMTFFDVVLRSVFNQPIEAATELTRILMAVVVFAVLPVVSFTGKHITVDLLDAWVTGRAQRIRDAFVDLVCGAALILPAMRCAKLAERAREYGDVTEYLNIPAHYLAWFITVFVMLAAVALIVRAIVRLIAPADSIKRNG